MQGKELIWLFSSKKDLREMPDDVQDVFGYALHLAQYGERHRRAKPFNIKGEPGLIEIVDDYNGDTYRAIYTVRYTNTVYVIHCFQKKSTSGIKTPQQEVDTVRARLLHLRDIIAKKQ